ncbi:GNAT family N-acetyltransferase [Streptomyces sp. NPDC002889]|uniref:GNAT family N-acetyltransferase n=1 Tax=Streptomyces sp. NPDC002889 TaxID=3364669 RepID=UPI0036A8E821
MLLTITNRTGDYYGDGSSNHIWETHDSDGTLIAELYVSTARNEIMNIWVAEDHRGEGHARALYETATDQMDVFHAPAAHRSPEGNAFAEAVGGESVAPYACDCYACDSQED